MPHSMVILIDSRPCQAQWDCIIRERDAWGPEAGPIEVDSGVVGSVGSAGTVE